MVLPSLPLHQPPMTTGDNASAYVEKHPIEAADSWEAHIQSSRLPNPKEGASADDAAHSVDDTTSTRRQLRHSSHHQHHHDHDNDDFDATRFEELKYQEDLKIKAQEQQLADKKLLKAAKKRQSRYQELYATNLGIGSQSVHGLMIDAGSTGSRMHVYEFEPRVLMNKYEVAQAVSGKKLSFPGTNSRWTERLRPGISEFATIENDEEMERAIANYLEPLLSFARSVLHSKEDEFENFPIFLKATAGLRTVPSKQRQRVISAVRKLFANDTYCPFWDETERVRVISGEEEAVYDWAGVNLLLGNLMSNSEGVGEAYGGKIQTYGALDMGGASTQISFYQPQGDVMSNLFKLQIGQGKHWNVYAHSHLMYGMDMAESRRKARLVSDTTAKERLQDGVYDPCLPGGGKKTIEFKSLIHVDDNGLETWNATVDDFASASSSADPGLYHAVLVNNEKTADQLSAVEEERGYKERSCGHDSNNNSPPMIAAVDKSWSEYISVYCMTRTAEETKHESSSVDDKSNEGDEGHASVDADLEPLPYAGGDYPQPGDLQNLAQQISMLFEADNDQSIDYLNVRGAILNEEAVDGRPLSADGKLEIRSLGIAFCELFSGGKIKAEAEMSQRLPSPLSSRPTRSTSHSLGQTAVEMGVEGEASKKREAQLQALKECYQRSTSSEFEVAMICGPSGVGKSKLAREFFLSVSKDYDGIFLSGRFDKVESQPLQAISSAFDKYCAWLTVKDVTMAEKVATALNVNLGEEMASLVIIMPNLATILGDDFDSKKSNENNTAVDAQKRLRYLFCQFIEVIAGCHEVPLILFLDDCQWIDNTSVSLLNQILMTLEAAFKDHRLFFFGSCRDDEISETHPLNLLLSSVSSFGTKTTKIHLTHLSKGAVNTMVSTTLSLLPRITRPFANILHHKTKGSPLFVKQVMMELYKQRLLFPSLSRRRWVWEADKILDMKIPENVAAFIAKSLDRLPPEVLTALTVLSCFGARAEISLMTVLEREINQSLIAPLEAAIAYSVLRKKDGEFFFMHDKIQEAAYSMMQPEESCLHHNLYGQALGFVAMRNNDDKLLLTAAGQINHGGTKAVINGQQAVLVAKMNLDAGKKAMDMSDFFLADSLFVHGISYLRRGHWDEHYGLSLELFNLAAKCAMMNAEHDRVKILTGQIMRYVKCFQDKCQAIFITSTLLTRSGSGPEAVGLINSTLSSLGEELPATITPTVINSYLENTKAQLAGISNDTLLSYSAMTNPSKILAMEFLVKLSEILTLIGEKAAMPLIPLKMIQISLTYGMSPLSPVSFAQYGNYLALVRGEFEEGYRYVKFTLTLMKQMPSRAHDGSIMFYSNHTRLHVEPIQSSIGFYVDAYRASMKSGDPYAIASSYAYDDICLWSGKELIAVVDSMKKTMKETRYHKNLVLLTLMLPMFRMALRLMGQSDAPEQDDHDLTNAFGETWNEDDITGKHAFPLHAMFFVNLSEALVFREFDEARDAADKYFLVDNIVGRHFSTSTMFFRRFYSGLVSFWVGREKNDSKWIARGCKCKEEIEKLAASASIWNFQNKAYLLKAEEQFSRRNFEEAETLYDAAILSSKAHKFVNEEALANELAAHFYLETGRRNKSVNYFSQAFEKYNEWGAVAKANTLRKHFDGSDWDQCKELARELFNKESNDWCNFSHRGSCSFAGVYQPERPPPELEFYAFSNYFHVWQFLQLESRSSIAQLEAKGREVCSQSWDDLVQYNEGNQQNIFTEEELKTYCFRAAYVHEILSYGYGFKPEEYVIATDIVNGQKVTWALGSILYEINTLPWDYIEMHGQRHVSNRAQNDFIANWGHQFSIFLTAIVIASILGVLLVFRRHRKRSNYFKDGYEYLSEAARIVEIEKLPHRCCPDFQGR
ncbi:hypothetical protein ACHAXM_002874 [Skeletonema potamos]